MLIMLPFFDLNTTLSYIVIKQEELVMEVKYKLSDATSIQNCKHFAKSGLKKQNGGQVCMEQNSIHTH